MSAQMMKKVMPMNRLLSLMMMVGALLSTVPALAAAPGITSNTSTTGSFTLTAQAAYLNQPDGNQVYAWGYGCSVIGSTPSFKPTLPNQTCNTMQVPGPTLIVTEGTSVTVTLANNLPTAAGNTSILFPDFSVTASCNASTPTGVQGLLTCEAAPGGSVTYTFTATTPGTHAYYSGTQSDLQIDMGLYGAIIVLPSNVPTVCGSLGVSSSSTNGLPVTNPGGNAKARAAWGEKEFRLAAAAYDHPGSCYDREYLFQFAEMDLNIHRTALAQVSDPKRIAACASGAGTPGCSLQVPTEPYHPNYFVINGRSMPDDMDPNFDSVYPHQPYNGNPHMHPGEEVLVRVIGQGRWQHPFHEHGNHVRILGRDGNLIKSVSDTYSPTAGTGTAALAGPLLFTTTTTPGQAFDGIFYWTGRGLNWDAYGHNPGSPDLAANLPCVPDANGYNTGAPTAINYFEWCQDHNKPLQAMPFGDVPSGGPATLPDANIFTNGAWYSGSPYLGPDATNRATGPTSAFQPSNTQANPGTERGYAFMWHSHNEREITTNNVFPGGMFMMMLVDSREFVIDESN
jgi:FtsP/CotA-like multicopper oxidase with cupredoxin domain